MRDLDSMMQISDARLETMTGEIAAAGPGDLVYLQAACYAELQVARAARRRAKLSHAGLRTLVLLALLVVVLALGAWLREALPNGSPVVLFAALGVLSMLAFWFVATHDRLNALDNRLHENADYWDARSRALERSHDFAAKQRQSAPR